MKHGTVVVSDNEIERWVNGCHVGSYHPSEWGWRYYPAGHARPSSLALSMVEALGRPDTWANPNGVDLARGKVGRLVRELAAPPARLPRDI